MLVSTHYMDEAERCHRLAYIAYGNLLTTGTPDEVLHKVSLTTWEVSGPAQKLSELSVLLKDKSGVAHVTAFGNTLHISGEDEVLLEKALAEFFQSKELTWKKTQASLEDVFIHLMKGREAQ